LKYILESFALVQSNGKTGLFIFEKTSLHGHVFAVPALVVPSSPDIPAAGKLAEAAGSTQLGPRSLAGLLQAGVLGNQAPGQHSLPLLSSAAL